MMTLTERINELNTLLEKDEFSVALQERFKNNQVNRAATMGYMIAVILLVITTIQRYLFREKD